MYTWIYVFRIDSRAFVEIRAEKRYYYSGYSRVYISLIRENRARGHNDGFNSRECSRSSEY